jgi:glutathione S-transferase
LDGGLNAKQRALGHLLRRTCEESLYFALCYSRWIDEANWPTVRQAFFGALPPAIEAQVAAQTREGVARALHGQGYGRHSPDEIYALGAADIDALAAALGGQPFFVADTPTTFDASIYATLVCLARAAVESPLKAGILAHANLRTYLDRVDQAMAVRQASAA